MERLPREKWAHLRDRAKERRISEQDLYRTGGVESDGPDVPDGDWYKDFGTFKLCGTCQYPSTFLMAGQAARGRQLSSKPYITCYNVIYDQDTGARPSSGR